MTQIRKEETIKQFAALPHDMQVSLLAGLMAGMSVNKDKERETGERVDQRNDQSPN